MECTQRLECTQDLCGTQIERVCPEQIGFLGICGKKYPVKKGPNKIGRDPSTCNIILNLNSISRQHAVINVLNKNNFMLMDLDSANKTKLSGLSIPPYIPQPLHNGDTIQFGEIFGIFRLLEEEDLDLPMTQALDIPDTPLPSKHVSRINAIKTVPESPDVSDKDDSFIIQSQPKAPQFPSPKSCNFIKPGKTISIQPMGSKKIDNVYWNSSKKSTSLNLDDSGDNLNDSMPPVKIEKEEEKENKISNNIHELETQMFPNPQTRNEEDVESIYSVNTQLPRFDSPASIHTINTQIPSATSSPSIYSLNTQLPCGTSPSIHSLNTQLPDAYSSPSVHSLDTQIPGDNLPDVCKITEQQDLQLDLCADERNCSNSVTETQLKPPVKEKTLVNSRSDSPASTKSSKLNISNDEVLFEDIEEPFEGFESQALLSEDIDLPINRLIEPELEPSQIPKPASAKRNMRINSDETESEPLSQIVIPKSLKRNMRIKSNSSADCEDDDIIPSQKIVEKKLEDDDSTDCEEDVMIELKTGTDVKIVDNIEDMPTQIITNRDPITDVNIAENLEDMPTQIIVNNDPSFVNNALSFEDLPTQVLDVDIIDKNVVVEKSNTTTDVDFEDLPTQILEENLPIKKRPVQTKQLTLKEENSPFKIPSNSALKAKKKEGSRTPKIRPIPFIAKMGSKNDDDKYYQNTQDIYDDLCTQKLDFIGTESVDKAIVNEEKSCNKLVLDPAVIDVDIEEKSAVLSKNLRNETASEDDVDSQVASMKKIPSDGSNASDVEVTPKKQRPFKFSDIDLPDSQEIKTSVSTVRAVVTESSSESETENNSEDQCTPIVFRKTIKPKSKPDVKIDLTKKFDLESLPTRVITRVRKPTAKLQDERNKKQTEILKPTFLTEQECEIDKEIITENISRLKNKNDKTKTIKSDQSIKKSTEIEIVQVATTESDKKHRGRRKKTEDVAIKAEVKLEKEKSLSTNDSKTTERRKREPRNTKKDPVLENQNQVTLSDKSDNKSFPVFESNEKTLINKSNIETRNTTASPVETKRSTRKRNVKAEKEKSPEKDSQTDKPKRKYTRKAKPEPKKEEKEPSPEKEIRRSKRQRPVKEETKKEALKSILKKNTSLSEVSAVYNISSCSNNNKRPFLDESEAPSAKRTRSVGTNNSTSKSTPAKQTQHVLFTAFPFEGVKTKLEGMGAVVVTDVLRSTVLLTKEIKRTFKLLCAVGLGKPIVGPKWVAACTENKVIVDPWQYLIKDEVAEKRFFFNLEQTLKGKRNFLKGYNISSTPSVLPNAHEMKLIVECSGGTWQEGGSQWVCVSVPDDAALWPSLRQRGATIVSTEFILGGVLRQRVDIQLNRFK